MSRYRSLMLALVSFSTTILGAVGPAAAQGTFGGEGRALFNADDEEASVRLESHHLEFETTESDGEPHWRVEATYTFGNPEDHEQELVVGFIEPGCKDTYSDCNSPELEDVSVVVDGEEVRVSETELREDHSYRYGDEGQTIHKFQVEFPPDEDVEIRQEFGHGYSATVTGISSVFGMDKALQFGLTPAASWKGEIEESRIEIERGERPWGFGYGPAEAAEDVDDGLKLKEYTERIEGGETKTSIALEAEDWEPKNDFRITFYSDVVEKGFGVTALFDDHAVTECPAQIVALKYLDLTRDGFDLDEEDYALPPTLDFDEYPDDLDEFIAKVAGDLSSGKLRQCRNAPYAKHGYDFNSDDLQKLFYEEGLSETTGTLTHRVAFRKNPHFSKDMLTRLDYGYVMMIRKAEKHKKEEESDDDSD